jgi:photosystem II stability/assembly factor-like uncharacterized protein
MNSFNSIKNGSSIINPKIKELQYNKYLQNIYIYGAYWSSNRKTPLRLYNKTGTEFLPSIATSSGNSDVFIAKYNINGTGVWRTRIGGPDNGSTETPINMLTDSSNNVYISGQYNLTTTVYNKTDTSFNTLNNVVGYNIFIVKYNSDGIGVWSTTINNEGNLLTKNMIMDSSNNIYISGWMLYDGTNGVATFYNSTDANFKTISRQNMSADMFIAKYDNSGNVLWVTKIGGTDAYNGGGGYQPVNMILDSSNNICISGYMSAQYCGPVTFYNSTDTTTSTFKQLSSSTGYDTFIAKYNSDGSGVWATLIGSNIDINGNARTIDMILDSANNVYISGFYYRDLTVYNSDNTSFATLTNLGSNDIFIAKYNSNGMCAWTTRIVSTGDDRPVKMILDLSNNLYITGYYNANLTLYNSTITANANFKTLVNDSGQNTFIAKYNSDGSGVWATRIGGIGKPDLSTFGNTWAQKGIYKQWSRVSISSNGMYQSATVSPNGYIYKSSDYGNNWSPTATNYGNLNWRGISVSLQGNYQTAVVNGGYIYTSSNYGNNWSPTATNYGNLNWFRVSISSDGRYQTAVASSGYIYTSSNYGNTWYAKTTSYGNLFWFGISVSWDGMYQTAIQLSGYIYSSTDFGNNWIKITSDEARNWYDVSISSSGQYQVAVVNGGYIYTSNNSGNGWSAKGIYENWNSVAISSSGQCIVALTGSTNNIYISLNYGNSWTTKTVEYCNCASISTDSRYITLGGSNNYIYVSSITSNLSINVNPVNLILDSSNNIYLSGSYDGNLKLYDNKDINFNILTNDIGIDTFIIKYNRDCSGIWVNKISGIGNTYPASLCIDSLQQVYVFGTYSNGGLILYNTNANIYSFASLYGIGAFVSKYDKNGTGLWATNITCESLTAYNILLDTPPLSII